jgi:hypothetical protein
MMVCIIALDRQGTAHTDTSWIVLVGVQQEPPSTGFVGGLAVPIKRSVTTRNMQS